MGPHERAPYQKKAKKESPEKGIKTTHGIPVSRIEEKFNKDQHEKEKMINRIHSIVNSRASSGKRPG